MSPDLSALSSAVKDSPAKVDPEVKAKPERRRFPAEYKLRILEESDAAHPERFVRKPPTVRPLPEAVWINRPQPHFSLKCLKTIETFLVSQSVIVLPARGI